MFKVVVPGTHNGGKHNDRTSKGRKNGRIRINGNEKLAMTLS